MRIWAAACVVATCASCGPADQGGAMVVEVRTNYTQVKELGSVGLYVAADAKQKLNQINYIVNKDGKTGDFSLPATLTIRSPKKGDVDVRVIAVGYDLTGSAIVVREASTRSSTGRTSQLTMPLLKENAMPMPQAPLGDVLNPLDVRDCPYHETRDGGKCVSSDIDEASLPNDMTHTNETFTTSFLQL